MEDSGLNLKLQDENSSLHYMWLSLLRVNKYIQWAQKVLVTDCYKIIILINNINIKNK